MVSPILLKDRTTEDLQETYDYHAERAADMATAVGDMGMLIEYANKTGMGELTVSRIKRIYESYVEFKTRADFDKEKAYNRLHRRLAGKL